MGQSPLSGKTFSQPTVTSCLEIDQQRKYDIGAAQLSVMQKNDLGQLLHYAPLRILTDMLLPYGELYVVGGAVRAVLSGDAPRDIDLTTSLDPQKVLEILNKNRIRGIPTGIRHGTVTALVGETSIEITTFRRPGFEIPRASLSDAFAKTIEEDLGGRDFTINAIALSTKNGDLVDPYGGVRDLATGILRGVVDPIMRFKEDPLRILRLVRFGPAGGRVLDKATEDAARLLIPTLDSVSPERIREELVGILMSAFPSAGFRTLVHLGLLASLFPELVPMVGCEQNQFHIHDVFEHTLWVIERCPPESLTLRLTALFHDTGKPYTLTIDDQGYRHFYLHELESARICDLVMNRLRFPGRLTDQVTRLVKYHMRPLDCGPSGVRRLIRDLEVDFELWRRFKEADSPPTMPDEEFSALAHRFDDLVQSEQARQEKIGHHRLAVRGDDLIALGIPEGKRIGKLLAYLEELILEHPDYNTREVLLAKVEDFLQEEGLPKES